MIRMTTYRELSELIHAFGHDGLNMVVLVSRGGLGKSQEAREALDAADIVSVGGHVTPLRLYQLLHDGQDMKVLFDEIDGLLSNTQHIGLLKQLCETQETKRVAWMSSDKRASEIDGGLGHFFTRSHVLMLCNSIESYNANVAALFSRAVAVLFDPTPLEILDRIKRFGTDHEIISFFERFHEGLTDFSLRSYVRLKELKEAGLDWHKYALDETDVQPKVREIADLLQRFRTDVERARHYSGSRRDFYNWKRQALEYLHRQSIRTLAQKTREPQSQDAA